MKYEYRVEVYDKREYIFYEEAVCMTFGFGTFKEASAFVEQMVVQHEKAVIISADTEK